MAIVINLDDHRTGIVPRKALTGSSAQILLFTGVRFERLDLSPTAGGTDARSPDDQALRNRAS